MTFSPVTAGTAALTKVNAQGTYGYGFYGVGVYGGTAVTVTAESAGTLTFTPKS